MPSEKQPGPEWTRAPWPGERVTPTASAWRCGPIFVLSELVVAEYPDGNGHGELEQLTGAPCPLHAGSSPNTTSRARQLGRLLP
jgi:hypothetical protein